MPKVRDYHDYEDEEDYSEQRGHKGGVRKKMRVGRRAETNREYKRRKRNNNPKYQ